MNHVAEDILMHYGVGKLDGAPGRGSGRYPLGSGDKPNQHSGDFLSRVREMEKSGLREKEIADALGMTTTELRVKRTLAKDEERSKLVATARRLRDEGNTLQEIADKMGYKNDSSVRSLLNENTEARMNKAKITANYLKEMCDTKGMIDVGTGVERELGVSREKMREALEILRAEGYEVYGGGVPQVTNPGKQTNIQVLCPPGTEHKEIYNFDDVHSVKDYDKILTDNGEKIRPAFQYPESMDSGRLMVRYAEQGGVDKDGLMEIRRGVNDLSLGENHYAQVRILVDGTHYLKGMAVYSDDLPAGVDVLFNTNKKEGTPVLGDKKNSVLKPISSDPDNPFGSLIKEHGGQSYYIGEDGKEHLSLINKRAEEGDWTKWANHVPSQFLAKQPVELINKQLNLTLADKRSEFDEIKSLNNPTIKRAMLDTFANDCDSAAAHLQAASLPRQMYNVILPLTTIKDTEVYAPNYKNGEKVALIRYPHGGIFEIPILTVNNKLEEGKKVVGTSAKDAVGINSRIAGILSGADFDGDTVMVIPTGRGVNIKNKPPLKDLEGFDPKAAYGPDSTDKPYKRMTNTQNEMGRVSNLIMDMTLAGASDSEVARAVRHSMVVIDAEKHNLDYKRSEIENGIPALKKKYQGRVEDGLYREGAATVITRAKAQESVIKRKGAPRIDEDGSLVWKNVEDPTFTTKDGKTKTRTQKSTQMAETKDAYTLVRDRNNPKEAAYADYANAMKVMANEARKEMIATPKLEYSASAKTAYQKEVDSLNSKLNIAEKNAPRERQAQVIANSVVKAKKEANPDMSKGDIKKASQQALTAARAKVGAKREPIKITDREWEAIQAGAISENKLSRIIKHVNTDELRQRATPLIDSFKNAIAGFEKVLGTVKDAWRNIFPATTAEQLRSTIENINALSKKLIISDETAEKLKSTFSGFFAVIGIGKTILSTFASAILPVFSKAFGDAGNGILGVTSRFGDWLAKQNEAIKNSETLQKVAATVAGVLSKAFSAIGKVVGFVWPIIESIILAIKDSFVTPGFTLFSSLLERIQKRLSGLSQNFEKVKTKISTGLSNIRQGLSNLSILSALKNVWGLLTKLASWLSSTFGNIIKNIADKIANADFKGILDIINGIIGIGAGIGGISIFKKISDGLKNITGLPEGVSALLGELKNVLSEFCTSIKADTLKKIAVSIGILAAALVVLSFVDSGKLAVAIGAITALFAELLGALAIFEKITDGKKISKASGVMIALSAAVLILAFALKKLSSLNPDELARGLVGVGVLIGMMVAAMKLLSTDGKKSVKGAMQMVLFAEAVKILASACKKLADLSWEELAKGLVGVGVLLAEISIFLNTAKLSGKAIGTATGMVILAGAIKILASACRSFADMSVESLIKGLASIGTLLLELALFTKIAGSAKHGLSIGISMIAIAAALKILVGVVRDLGALSVETIGKGLLGMAGALAAIALAVNLIPARIALVGPAMVVMAGALMIISSVIKKMGQMKWASIGKGLAALGGSLLILAIAVNAMRGAISGAAALMAVSLAIAILTPALKALGSMSLENVLTALVALAGVFTVLGVAGLALQFVAPTLLVLAGALTLLGVAAIAAGAGMLLIGAGMTSVAVGVASLSSAIGANIEGAVTGVRDFLIGLADTIPTVLIKFADGIVSFFKTIGDSSPELKESLKSMILSALDVVNTCAPEIIETLLSLLVTAMSSLATHAPELVSAAMELLRGVLSALKERMPELVAMAFEIIGDFFDGIINALKSMDRETLENTVLGVGLLAGVLTGLTALSGYIPSAMVGVLGFGAVIAELGGIFAALGGLSQIPGFTWLIEEGGEFGEKVGTALGKFIGGIIGGVVEGATSTLPAVGQSLSDFMTNAEGFFDGVSGLDDGIFNSIGQLATAILKITAADLLEGISSWVSGSSSISSFSNTLPELGKALTAYADSLGESLKDSSKIDASTNLASLLATLDADTIQKTGGVVQALVGESGLAQFATNLPLLAQGLSDYANIINSSTFDEDKVTASTNLAEMLAVLASDSIPTKGGLFNWFEGESGLGDFGSQLSGLGAGLAEYIDTISGTNFDQTAVDASVNLATMLAVLASDTMLWTLLFIIPGIIKAYSYRLVPYIIKDEPELSAMETIRRSKELMSGNKWKAFVLDLSFIGWYMLGVVTLGLVNVFWTEPYRESSCAVFYRELKNGF